MSFQNDKGIVDYAKMIPNYDVLIADKNNIGKVHVVYTCSARNYVI